MRIVHSVFIIFGFFQISLQLRRAKKKEKKEKKRIEGKPSVEQKAAQLEIPERWLSETVADSLHIDPARSNAARVYCSSLDFERGVKMHVRLLFSTTFRRGAFCFLHLTVFSPFRIDFLLPPDKVFRVLHYPSCIFSV